jgi:plastocyanin
LFACGSEEAANVDPQIVKVVDDEFSPRVLRVEPGTTVIWESGGANNHNVIASDGSWQAISSDYFEYGIITKGDQYSTHLMSLVFMNTTVPIMEQIIKGWLEQLLLAI